MAAASATPTSPRSPSATSSPSATFPLTRDSLVRYAGASGDFNPIHYRDDVAASVGLPGVLAHGMLTMGFAVQPVVDWAGDPGRVADYQVRFTRPVVVDPEQRRARHGRRQGRPARRGRAPSPASTSP